MDFHAGDTVMHWMHGLGTIIRREEREVLGRATLFYAVKVDKMIIWVPVDGKTGQRLRRPAGRTRFKRIVAWLSEPGDALPFDRHERRLLLAEYLSDGRLESLVRVMRGLAAYKEIRSLNDHDQAVVRRVQAALIAEWAHVLDITPDQAEIQMTRLLKTAAA